MRNYGCVGSKVGVEAQMLEFELNGQLEKGDLIKGTGGARVISYFQVTHTIHFLAIYPKNEHSVLSPQEKKMPILSAQLEQNLKDVKAYKSGKMKFRTTTVAKDGARTS